MRRVALTFVALSLVACSEGAKTDAQVSGSSAAVAALAPRGSLSSDAAAEVAAQKALKGDADAAWELVGYYSGEHFDRQRNEYWHQVAVDNRNSNALTHLGQNLATANDPCVVLRGIYGLELALKSLPADGEDAKSLRREIDHAEARSRTMTPGNCLNTTASLR